VLENLKDYAVKALVNAVDHLGTVAYKLDEVLSQQISEISSVEIRVSGLTQVIYQLQDSCWNKQERNPFPWRSSYFAESLPINFEYLKDNMCP
jgi:hypothetical protein